ncbi:hypothetical protein [Rhizobium sp. 9140]|uniref:hypothetical protein n=1 Tax=Rhizobium sp. 9140 TaxID=1761900 RepID=UPI0007953CCB|nr:hypothetical protein [Rhizobium sp. 9140]CZT35367.1 hypothetical protein GA0004734_00023770 [Rhizobium sp. 9140]
MRDQLLIHTLKNRGARVKTDPLADPLDHPSWDGLRWMVPLLAVLFQSTRPSSRKTKPARPPKRNRLYTRSPLRMR